ncbi:hypothetical protein [Marinobacterium arenosum]|nr:hypothetical protein [Marinobacterium arenosum]
MATIATLIALAALLYLAVRHEIRPGMQPIRIRTDEQSPRRRPRR